MKTEIRNNFKITNPNVLKSYFEFLSFDIRILLGFRYSFFGFGGFKYLKILAIERCFIG